MGVLSHVPKDEVSSCCSISWETLEPFRSCWCPFLGQGHRSGALKPDFNLY